MKRTEKRKEKNSIILSVVVMLIMATLVVFISERLTDSKEEESVNNQEQEKKEEKLVIWYYDSLYTDYLNYLSETYSDKNDVQVIVKQISADGYLEEINKASSSGKDYPDLYILPQEMLEKAYLGGLAQINEHDKQYSEKNYSKTALSSITYKNKKVAYPFSFDVGFVVYNKAYTDSEPKSFDEILKYAENFDGENYPDVMTVLEWNPADIMYNYGFVGSYMECGGINGDDETVFDVTNENVKASLKYYVKLKEYFSIEMENVSDRKIKQDFVKGKIVYTIAGMEYFNYFSKKDVEFAVSKFPHLNEELSTKALATTNVLVVNPFTDYQRETEKLAMYMTYDNPQKVYELSGRLSPAIYDYEDENLNKILECYADSVVMPKLMNTLDYKQRLTVTLNNIWNGAKIKDSLNNLKSEMSIELKNN